MAAPRRAGTTTPSNSVASATGYAEASEMDKYRLVSNIGQGSFGVISKVQRINDNKDFALKQLDYGKMTERDRKQILAEVAILESLKHRNIVQLVQKIKDPKNERIFIVMEFCTSGDLGSLIRKAKRSNTPLPDDQIWSIFLQITLALHHCHWPNERPRVANGRADGVAARTQVLHRDLKPENVFLSGDVVKLGDFGLSKDMAGLAFTSTYVGTPLYMPPEILAENRYDTKSDIWSLGCLVFEMCALSSPFASAKTQEELITMVKSGKLPPLPSHISPSLKAVIRAMLNLNPVRRPSTRDLLEMDEMKVHHKGFHVQMQTMQLTKRRDDLLQFQADLQQREARLQERTSALQKEYVEMSQREASVRELEAALNAREAELKDRENVLCENNRRISQARDAIRREWENIREVKDAQAKDLMELPVASPEEIVPEAAPNRPPLEERKTFPVPATSSRFQRHPSYDETPSKIPFPSAFASPVPLDQRLTNKISGLPARRGSSAGMGSSNLQRRLASKSMTNLAARARSDDEFVAPLQSTPAKQARAQGTPYRHVTGRTSIGSPGELDRVFAEDITMATASFAISPAHSLLSTPFLPRPRKFSDTVDDSPCLPPTQIPAPTYVYRPEATPAKWSADDPDLPSPFIRRTVPAAPNLTGASATSTDRAPLGSINPQPAGGPTPATSTANGAISGLPNGAASGSVRKIPRSRSGTNLHANMLKSNFNAATSAVSRTPAAPGLGTGSAVRTRPVVGRDPARC